MAVTNQISKLKEHILSDAISEKLTAELQMNTGKSDFFTVFLSVCNKKDRARVFHGSGNTLGAAWGNAEKRLGEYRKKRLAAKKPFAVAWAKADVVTHYEEIPTVDLNKLVVKHQWHNFVRNGISFDSSFGKAFIEAEVNGNKMLNYHYSQQDLSAEKVDYDSILINLDNINNYLKSYYSMAPINAIPDKITVFTTQCCFCGEDGVVHELYGDSSSYDYGRRKIDVVDAEVVKDVIVGASEYLAGLIEKNGKFIYGYFPIFDGEITGYNIVRHASSLWSLVNLYRMSGDDSLIPKLDLSIEYMETYIEHKDENTAFLVERSTGEIKLGANGVAIIMYTEYMDVFKSDKYIDIVRKLANGILELQNPETGGYWHVLEFPGFERKEEHRIVYYDGEATFALARAYTYTKEQKFLDGAKAAVEMFIAKNYIIHRDHWVAYALFEVTKYIEDVRYYEFALQNADKSLKGIYERATSFHTYLEMLMAAWQTYQRALRNKIDSAYIKNYDPTYFAQTIYHRARHMLNGYFYPEYAMYMKAPGKVVGSFMVRHHNYRVRIDDIQHFIGGYYFYSVYYDEIKAHLTDAFLRGLEN